MTLLQGPKDPVLPTLIYIPTSCKKMDLIWNKFGNAMDNEVLKEIESYRYRFIFAIL